MCLCVFLFVLAKKNKNSSQVVSSVQKSLYTLLYVYAPSADNTEVQRKCFVQLYPVIQKHT